MVLPVAHLSHFYDITLKYGVCSVLKIFKDLKISASFSFLRGADDLLPILAFVALRSETPQLVSECAALEEFIHEGCVLEFISTF